jgi:bifunctional non-homologous end joining protein LigD
MPPGAKKRKFPAFEEPMLATLAREPFTGPDWLFEVKWDGFRALAYCHSGKQPKLYSRNGKLFSKYGQVIQALNDLQDDMVLDGEIVAFDKNGRSSFQTLQNFERRETFLFYYVFDLLHYKGYDLRRVPLLDRKALLKDALPDSEVIRFSDHKVDAGLEMYKEAEKKGLEGIMAKKCDSLYYSGQRSEEWLKIKIFKTQEGIITGFTDPKGSREFFGTLILAAWDNGRLRFIGSSGGGFTREELKDLYALLRPLEISEPVLTEKGIPNVKNIHWVKPEIVCECTYSEWTTKGTMRHPVYRGLRPDKSPRQVVVETPKA